MNNKPAIIVFEGFWKIGKSSIVKKISEIFGYGIYHEPNHLDQPISGNPSDWYITQHLNGLKQLADQTNVLVERSLLSSAAYLYAQNGDENKVAEIVKDFYSFYMDKKPLIVFIYGDHDLLSTQAAEVKDEETKTLIATPDFLKRYEDFYRLILPLKFNIVPLMVKVAGTGSESYSAAADNIISAIDHNRIGQVNVACYRLNNKAVEFLLLKRNPQKGSFWQVVTGGIKIHQNLTEAAQAELGEELSLNVKLDNFLKSDFSFYYVGAEGYELNEYVFGYKLEATDEVTLSDEHVESRFVSLDEALSLLKYDSNKQALKHISQQLSTLI